MNPKVDEFFRKAKKWREELEQLRAIVLDCGLVEELKWYQPCYTFQKTNVIILGGFKDCCVISFFKGVLLKDPSGILEKAGPNTQSVRVIRFTRLPEIVKLAPLLKTYVHEAVELEKSGTKINSKSGPELILPKEFQKRLAEDPVFEKAFTALTPGRQRAYNLYFSAAKRSQTRITRIDKCLPQILRGKGLND